MREKRKQYLKSVEHRVVHTDVKQKFENVKKEIISLKDANSNIKGCLQGYASQDIGGRATLREVDNI
jgi:hypothetical protein